MYIIDQARGQDGWILAEFSFCVFMDLDEVEVHKNASLNWRSRPVPTAFIHKVVHWEEDQNN